MILSDILNILGSMVLRVSATCNMLQNIENISIDSRKIRHNSAFLTLKGASFDGNLFINDALKNGAKLIITEHQPLAKVDYDYVVVKNIDNFLYELIDLIYPHQPSTVFAVTGTNGKTSTVHYIRLLAQFLSYNSASIGTLGLIHALNPSKASHTSSLTTPDIVELSFMLHNLVQNKVTHVAMEASSHGLQQKRLQKVQIKVAAFLNLTQDHLDYHGDMENYFQAKFKLFTDFKYQTAVVNADDYYGQRIISYLKANKIPYIDFGKAAETIVLTEVSKQGVAQIVNFSYKNAEFTVKLNLFGDFQVENFLCALSCLLANGENINKILPHVEKLRAVDGRMQIVKVQNQDKYVVVDYAHTPDSLEKALKTIKKYQDKNRIIVVFGCGGDRDSTKRVIMGKIAAENADIAIVTDDNPRTENDASIRKMILDASPLLHEVPNRKNAIRSAVEMMQNGDILLIAGKGHEKYQIIGNKYHYFDDVEEAKQALSQLTGEKNVFVG